LIHHQIPIYRTFCGGFIFCSEGCKTNATICNRINIISLCQNGLLCKTTVRFSCILRNNCHQRCVPFSLFFLEIPFSFFAVPFCPRLRLGICAENHHTADNQRRHNIGTDSDQDFQQNILYNMHVRDSEHIRIFRFYSHTL